MLTQKTTPKKRNEQSQLIAKNCFVGEFLHFMNICQKLQKKFKKQQKTCQIKKRHQQSNIWTRLRFATSVHLIATKMDNHCLIDFNNECKTIHCYQIKDKPFCFVLKIFCMCFNIYLNF